MNNHAHAIASCIIVPLLPLAAAILFVIPFYLGFYRLNSLYHITTLIGLYPAIIYFATKYKWVKIYTDNL